MDYFESTAGGITLRVRLTPNSSCCCKGGVWVDERGVAYLQIKVRAVPEKGKANAELIKFLAAEFDVAKSRIELVSGETDRNKKLLIAGDGDELVAVAAKLNEQET